MHKSARPTAHDMRAMKVRGEKIGMLYVTTLDEAAANAVGTNMPSIEGRFFSPAPACLRRDQRQSLRRNSGPRPRTTDAIPNDAEIGKS